MTGEIYFTYKGGAVKKATFTKGGGTANYINAPVGHDIEIVSYAVSLANDATVVTRSLTLSIKDAAGGTGNTLLTPFTGSFVASDTKAYAGGITQAGGAYNGVTDWHEMIVPAGGSFAAAEAAFVAGDAWTIRVIYRDIPVDGFV